MQFTQPYGTVEKKTLLHGFIYIWLRNTEDIPVQNSVNSLSKYKKSVHIFCLDLNISNVRRGETKNQLLN